MTLIDQIRKALEAGPTPGEWIAKDSRGAGLEIYADVGSQLKGESHQWPAFSTANADVKTNLVAYETWVQFPTEKLANIQARNALFIAACNPVAIAALLASHDAAVQRAAEMQERCARECEEQARQCQPASYDHSDEAETWRKHGEILIECAAAIRAIKE